VYQYQSYGLKSFPTAIYATVPRTEILAKSLRWHTATHQGVTCAEARVSGASSKQHFHYGG